MRCHDTLEDPYEEAAQQLFEHAPHSLEYVPRDHVPVFVPEFKHPEDLVPAEDEAPASLLPLGFLSPRIRPLSLRALGAELNAIASSLYHSLHPSGTPPLLPIPLYTPSTSRRAGIPEADTPPRNRLLLATPRPSCEVGESSAAAARRLGHTMAYGVDCSYVETRLRDTKRRIMTALELVNLRVSYQVDVCTRESSEFSTRHHDAQKDRAAMRAEIEVLRSERLAYEQEGIQTREALARSEAYCRALEARVAVIVELEKDLSKFEAKSIAFEIALQHKSRENNSLKTLQKENENFMASLQIENVHLKQTYKDLFELVQWSRVKTNHCDEVKVKVNFDEIKSKNIEVQHQVKSLIKENAHLKLTYQSLFDLIKKSLVQTKNSNVTQNEAENLKSKLFEFAETKFNTILEKIEFFKKNHFDLFSSLNVDCDLSELKKASREKHNLFENKTSVFQIKINDLDKSLAKQTKENYDLLMKIDNLENVFADQEKMATFGKWNVFDKENCDFGSKVIHLKKIIAQKSKDFDDVNLELSNRTAKFEAYFEKLKNTKVVLEQQLARKVDDSKAEKDQF
uniref:Uncharacterized protein n=1 Tax=Tanacetum cinerariifolium TaxID=118510 RepID=A0A6L2KTQ9_TANCI|nr:hypothetical protein [Tanacetum cinerariifolium]